MLMEMKLDQCVEMLPYSPEVSPASLTALQENVGLACKLARILFDYDDTEECFNAIDGVIAKYENNYIDEVKKMIEEDKQADGDDV